MARSDYVLCPRGIGTSSFRLFEAMEAGRAPVIISNDWVQPGFIDWDFAVRIAENDIGCIPDYLAAIRDEAKDRGRAARAAWEQWFAPDRLFNSAAQVLAELSESRHEACPAVHFQSVRKVMIEGELRFVTTARKLRSRFADVLPDSAS